MEREALAREHQQVFRHVQSDHTSAAAYQWQRVLTVAAAIIQHGPAVDVANQMKRVFERVRRICRRIQVPLQVPLRHAQAFDGGVPCLDAATLNLGFFPRANSRQFGHRCDLESTRRVVCEGSGLDGAVVPVRAVRVVSRAGDRIRRDAQVVAIFSTADHGTQNTLARRNPPNVGPINTRMPMSMENAAGTKTMRAVREKSAET